MTALTVTGIRTTPCTMASGQWVTLLETAEGVTLDAFLLAVHVPWDERDGVELCRRELEAARQMVGRRYEVEGSIMGDGELVADRCR